MLTLATKDIIHIKPILFESGYLSILCFKTTLNSSNFLVLIFALLLCAHHIDMPSAKTKRLHNKQRYASAKEDIRAACRNYYAANADKCREVFKRAYASDPKKFKEASKKAYASDPEKFKEASKRAYASDPEKFKEASKKAYASDPQKFKEAFKKSYKENPAKCKLSFKENYSEHREEICRKKREQYVLRAPNEGLVKSFVEGLIIY